MQVQHPDLTFTVAVGFTTQRPVIPEQHLHHVIVTAQDDIEARLTAHAMVRGHRGVVMVTSAKIINVIA